MQLVYVGGEQSSAEDHVGRWHVKWLGRADQDRSDGLHDGRPMTHLQTRSAHALAGAQGESAPRKPTLGGCEPRNCRLLRPATLLRLFSA